MSRQKASILCNEVFLVRLYKSLGDYDTVRGIFSGHVGTKGVTKDALEAEERVDYLEALSHYRDVRMYITPLPVNIQIISFIHQCPMMIIPLG